MAEHDDLNEVYEPPALVAVGDFTELTLGWTGSCPTDWWGSPAWIC